MFPAVSLRDFFITSFDLYLIIVARYFLFAGLFFWLLWKHETSCQRLQDTTPTPKTIKSEMKWSVLTSVIFALPGSYMIEAWKHGGTQIYFE